MQIQLNANVSSQPNFGMAKLTKKGECAAKRFVTKELQVFFDQAPYCKKNMLKNVLKYDVKSQELNDLFEYGVTNFADKNAQFVKKQLMPKTGRWKIKSYLAKEHQIAAEQFAKENEKAAHVTLLTEEGDCLVKNILNVFDSNINNPLVTRKQGLKMLDTIKQYLSSSDHMSRAAIMTDKIYSKK